MILVGVAAGMLLWCVVHFAGWLSIQDIPGRPFNWRIIWMSAYYRWLDRGRLR